MWCHVISFETMSGNMMHESCVQSCGVLCYRLIGVSEGVVKYGVVTAVRVVTVQ